MMFIFINLFRIMNPNYFIFELNIFLLKLIFCKNKKIIFFRLAKVAISKGIEVPIEDGFKIEKQCHTQLLDTQDRLEGLAAFSAKRVPVYRGL